MNKNKKLTIFKLITLIGYIFVSLFLVIESCIPGSSSQQQSSSIGEALANFFNNISGDQTVKKEPKSLIIKNKINEAYHYDSYQLEVDLQPLDCSYKSLMFQSSDSSIATINEKGFINFLNIGDVTISVFNVDFPSIKDSFTINVNPVLCQNITSHIDSTMDESNVYTLDINKTYIIQTTFAPSTTSNKDLAYFVDKPNYISINEEGRITPLIESNDEIITITIKSSNDKSSTIKVKVIKSVGEEHLLTSDFHVKLSSLSGTGSVTSTVNPNYKNRLLVNRTYKLEPILDNINSYDFSYLSSNPSVIEISKTGIIKTLNTSKHELITLTILDNKTNYKGVINLSVYHYIEMDKTTYENGYTLNGNNLEYDKENDLYSIFNGTPLTFKMYITESSTYNKLDYSSSDSSIASVGKDGIITPKKAGKVKIKARCDDGYRPLDGLYPALEVEVEIEIKPTPLIIDIETFSQHLRKVIGHFGAFLILGVFSTFMFILFFKKEKRIISFIINFIQGFILASLTEIIQLFVPGRAGVFSDVLIDYGGFLISALIITLGYIIFYFISKKKEKN